MVNVCLEGMGNHKMLKGNKQHVFEKEREKIIFDLHKLFAMNSKIQHLKYKINYSFPRVSCNYQRFNKEEHLFLSFPECLQFLEQNFYPLISGYRMKYFYYRLVYKK